MDLTQLNGWTPVTSQVEILTKIKEFNKEINLMHWEHGFYQTTLAHLEETYGDLHMLRLTSELQVRVEGMERMERMEVWRYGGMNEEGSSGMGRDGPFIHGRRDEGGMKEG